MTLVDNKGRLFGKVNLVDLLVVLAILGVVGLYGYKKYMPKPAATGAEQVQVTFRVQKVAPDAVKAIQVGDRVVESATGSPLGKVVKIETPKAVITSETGEYVSQYYVDLYLTVEGPGNATADTPKLGNTDQYRGKGTFLRTLGPNAWAGTGYAMSVTKAPAK